MWVMPAPGPRAASSGHPFHCWLIASYVTDSHLSVSYEGERPIYRGRTVMLTVPFHCCSVLSPAHSRQ